MMLASGPSGPMYLEDAVDLAIILASTRRMPDPSQWITDDHERRNRDALMGIF